MKIAQFADKNFVATWFVWNVSTFKALHLNTVPSPEGYTCFADTHGSLKNKGVSLITECRIQHANQEFGIVEYRGFSACSAEDKVFLPVGMKLALERAFMFGKDNYQLNAKNDIADFYNALFKEGTFGYKLLGMIDREGDNLRFDVSDKFQNVINDLHSGYDECDECVGCDDDDFDDNDDNEDDDYILETVEYCDQFGCNKEFYHMCVYDKAKNSGYINY